MPIQPSGGGAPKDAAYWLFGTNAYLTAEVNLYSFQHVNLVKNSPGQIVTDGAEPQWWDDVANAAITDEDAVGETIPDKTDRVFKVATTANDVYGYQTFTFADESLLDAGQTVVSASVWAYCASGAKASMALYGTNLGLQESSQAGAGAWELLTVEGVTLNAGDTSIQMRLIVDTDTAWFTMPQLNPGPRALPWMPRGQYFVPTAGTRVLNRTGGDLAETDLACNAASHNLATGISVFTYVTEANGTIGSYLMVGHSNDLVGAAQSVSVTQCIVINTVMRGNVSYVACDDGQNIRYSVSEVDDDGDFVAILDVNGYWRWGP